MILWSLVINKLHLFLIRILKIGSELILSVCILWYSLEIAPDYYKQSRIELNFKNRMGLDNERSLFSINPLIRKGIPLYVELQGITSAEINCQSSISYESLS